MTGCPLKKPLVERSFRPTGALERVAAEHLGPIQEFVYLFLR
jgi:hypothetical protein